MNDHINYNKFTKSTIYSDISFVLAAWLAYKLKKNTEKNVHTQEVTGLRVHSRTYYLAKLYGSILS